MRAKLLWGFDLPYMLTGFLNEHPRAAIKFKGAPTKGDIVDFYNLIWE
jgi:4-hydroxy 2-oxovalerate aldolase